MTDQPYQHSFQVAGYGSESSNNALTDFQHMNISSHNFWCQMCALQHSECICSYMEPSPTTSSWPGSYPVSGAISPWGNQDPYAHMRTVPPLSIPATYSTHSATDPSPSSAVSAQYSVWSPSPISPTSRTNTNAMQSESAVASNSQLKSTKPTRDEAKEKRLQQNRRSQQSFRHRQAKLVEDLKGKVQELTKENADLIKVISSFGDAGEIVRDRVKRKV